MSFIVLIMYGFGVFGCYRQALKELPERERTVALFASFAWPILIPIAGGFEFYKTIKGLSKQ